MKRLHKHFYFKRTDSYMWIDWVAHNGFGLLPTLKINTTFQGVNFYFLFMWWKFQWYWARSR